MHFFFRAVLTLAILPLALRAQVAPDPAPPRLTPTVFAYLQYGDTLAYEAVLPDSTMIRGAYLIPKQGRVAWDHVLEHGTPHMLTLSFFPPEDQGVVVRAYRQIDYLLQRDSMHVTTQDADGQRAEVRVARDSAIAVFGRSMTHIAYLGFYAVQAQRSRLPFFLTSSGKTVDATVEVAGERLAIIVDGLRIESLWEGATLVEVRVPSQGLVVRRVKPS
jgi:hypothetical protein